MNGLRKTIFLILIIIVQGYTRQSPNNSIQKESVVIYTDSLSYFIKSDDPVLLAIDKMAKMPYFERDSKHDFNITQYIEDQTNVPFYNDSILTIRLRKLDEKTPFSLVLNEHVRKYIDIYAKQWRRHTSKMLGLSEMYFPMFEELLDKHNLPLEFKYLAVVESALNPKAKSGVGAVGLWQFMYNTGKMFGVNATSYKDERSDPYKSTEAACLYFKYLYKMYGDWNLVLAAYNCGPGTVNKAIRRSGQKKDYWRIWSYLPAETRNYVPAFIAANYMHAYAHKHGIKAIEPAKKYFEYDTIQVNKRIDLEEVATVLNIPFDLLEMLNPVYKHSVIPMDGQSNLLYLPHEKIGLFIQNENFIYDLSLEEKGIIRPPQPLVALQHKTRHKVLPGETLRSISRKYHIDKRDIKKWNNMLTDEVTENQKITLYLTGNESLLDDPLSLKKSNDKAAM